MLPHSHLERRRQVLGEQISSVDHRMVEYTTSLNNMEMGLDHRRVVLVEKKSSSDRMWKLIGALFFLALCFAGVLLFVWYLNGRPEAQVRRKHVEDLCTYVKDVCIRESNLVASSPPPRSLAQARSKL